MMQRLLTLGCLLVVACAPAATTTAPSTAPTAAAPGTESPPSGRLARDVLPLRYRLDLHVDPDQALFEGTVAIELQITKPTRSFWLHGKNLQVSAATLTLAGGEAMPATYAQRTEEGTALVTLPKEVAPQNATLSVTYRAPFDEGLEGLYRVRESERWYAFTQFEAISARLCFPGFDEPSFKAPFEVTLEVREGHEALANTPALSREPATAGWHRVRFAPTPPLPTYLVAIAVGPFDIVQGAPVPAFGSRPAIPLRGVTVAGKGHKLAYALAQTGALLNTIEQMFGQPYPFEKLDLVAVPDFAAGAMENVGLITFREYLLLLDETSPAQQKRSFAYVMAHELAHQWFGNLVTMPWWDDIWLNEAFATWVEYRAVEIWRPEYKSGLAQIEDTFDAFSSDSLVAARQIRQPIETNHDIHNAFDAITYGKGGGVLSMFERYLGAEKFRKGVSFYLEKHRFGTATSDDFLAGLSEGSGTDVTAAFQTFLVQPGIPVVTVTPRCDASGAALELSQERYFPVGSRGDRAQVWQVPFCAKTGRGKEVAEQCVLLSEPKATLPLTGGCPDWVLPNAEAAGYYRWRMAADARKALRDKGFPRLTAKDAMSLADSVNAGFSDASLSAAEVFELAKLLGRHPERAVAVRPMHVLEFAAERLADDTDRNRVEGFVRDLYKPTYDRLGLDPKTPKEDEDLRLLRRDVINFLAQVGREPALRKALVERAGRYLGWHTPAREPQALEVNLVGTALTTAGEENGLPFAQFVEGLLVKENDAMERMYLLAAMGAITDAAGAEEVRALSLRETLRANEIFHLLRNHVEQRANIAPTWTWLQNNYAPLVEKLPPNHAGRLPWLGAALCAPERASELRAFFEQRVQALPGGPRNLEGSQEAVELCAALIDAHRQHAHDFFAARAAGGGKGASSRSK